MNIRNEFRILFKLFIIVSAVINFAFTFHGVASHNSMYLLVSIPFYTLVTSGVVLIFFLQLYEPIFRPILKVIIKPFILCFDAVICTKKTTQNTKLAKVTNLRKISLKRNSKRNSLDIP